ncbi:MAG TPA: hypothetical protein VFA70_15775, partial [Dehalococcoidia bacterium]|nr:hypothetical protein [Dehalococcoidia bacterium]
ARLRPAVSATAGFLEARSRNEFLRRRDEVASMAAALRREPAADRAAIERSLAAELRRLEDVFAVEVEATVASVAFVRSRLVEVALERPGGRELLVTVDVGRRQVLPPACGACGGPCHSGAVCGEGHVVCASCSATAPRDARCPVCAHGRGAGAPHEHAMAGGLPSGEQLRAASLASMPDAVWSACAAWLLEQRGIAVQRVTAGQAGLTIYGAQGERAVFASAVRSDVGWRLGEHDVRRAAALTAGQPGALGILLSPSIADDGARAEADRLGVELWDGVAMDALLARAGSRYEDERAAAADERARRLALAGSVRAELVAAMEAAEAALSTGDSGPALSGQRRVAAEVRAVNEARGVVLQAFAAWETAVADYVSAFGGRAERDGSLGVIATEDTLASLRERIRHLAAVTGPAAGTVGASAGRGELGYSAWRKAVVEELVARCEAVRWRALSVDPAEASDFAAARDEQAALKAEEATVAAERAAMRVEAAYVQLVERARL